MPVLIQGVDDSIKRTLLTTTGDIIAASGASTPSRIAAPASGQVLTGQGVGVLPAWAAAASAAQITLGNYTGDGTNNRAIAHGLSGTPKIVLIVCDSNPELFRIIQGWARVVTTGSYANIAVTAMDATNFYVTADAVSTGANTNLRTYRWAALT